MSLNLTALGGTALLTGFRAALFAAKVLLIHGLIRLTFVNVTRSFLIVVSFISPVLSYFRRDVVLVFLRQAEERFEGAGREFIQSHDGLPT
jgi:hypothetical protein